MWYSTGCRLSYVKAALESELSDMGNGKARIHTSAARKSTNNWAVENARFCGEIATCF